MIIVGHRFVGRPMSVYAAAYFARRPSRYFLLWAVTSQAFGQKQRSTHHQLVGTPAFWMAGMSWSKFKWPVPNGLWVDVLCSFRLPSESMRCTWVIFPLSFSSNSAA